MSQSGSSILPGTILSFRSVAGHPIFSRVTGVDSPKGQCAVLLINFYEMTLKNLFISRFYVCSIKKASAFKVVGLVFGGITAVAAIITVVATVDSAFTNRRNTLANIKTAEAAEKAAHAAKKTADIQAVAQGLLSKEQYWDSYPEDRPKSYIPPINNTIQNPPQIQDTLPQKPSNGVTTPWDGLKEWWKGKGRGQ